MCALHQWFPAEIVLGELSELLSRVLVFLIRYLCVSGSGENVSFCLRESTMKSGHCFGTFGCYPVVLTVERLGGVYVFLHITKISKARHKNLKGSKIGRSLPMI